MSVAHYLLGSYEQAVDGARRCVQMRPDFLPAHRVLCAGLAQQGLIDEAKVVLSRIREVMPDISISSLERFLPYSTPSGMAHFLDGLRKAGLPE